VFIFWSGARFSKAPETFRVRKAKAKSRTVTLAELFYSHFLNMRRASLHTRSFRRIHFSVFTYRWTKNGFTARRVSGAFEKRSSGVIALNSLHSLTSSVFLRLCSSSSSKFLWLWVLSLRVSFLNRLNSDLEIKKNNEISPKRQNTLKEFLK